METLVYSLQSEVFRVENRRIAIYNLDCLELMDSLPDESVDCIVTSPPYNIGTDYEMYDDRMEREQYLYWMRTWLDKIYSLLSPDGSLFLNLGGIPSNPWLPFEVLNLIRTSTKFHLQNVIHWIKAISIGEESYGHYKPINSNRYLHDSHEYIFHLTRTGRVPLDRLAIGVPYQDKSNINRWGTKKDLRCRGNIWYLPYTTIQSQKKERPHPSSFPIELPLRCFKLHGVERIRRAMDPCLGIGATALAAIDLGLEFIGCEIEEEYYDISRNRILERIPEKGDGVLS